MKSLNQYINEVSSGLLARAHNAQLKRNGGAESNRSRKFARGAHAALDREMGLEDSVSGSERKCNYVDLGLPSGTMWATCNVGADKPEDPGLLFQFGRVDGYKYGDKNNNFRNKEQNKQDTGDVYKPKSSSGKIYNEGDTLELEDDAAHVNMGGKWRMPTNDELEELRDNTTQTYETINGIKGMMFTSKINGHQLFIPFGGYCYNGIFRYLGSYTEMWSSQVHPYTVNHAYRLSYGSSGNVNVYYSERIYAFSVRGVFKK